MSRGPFLCRCECRCECVWSESKPRVKVSGLSPFKRVHLPARRYDCLLGVSRKYCRPLWGCGFTEDERSPRKPAPLSFGRLSGFVLSVILMV